MKKYFGTDGIRSLVGTSRMHPEFILKLGWALGMVLKEETRHQPTVMIGKDTRISGYMFESALQAGLSAAGADIGLTGPITTPAIAYLTRTMSADAGIMISASHNPFHDNGIKIFSHQGTKISDEQEQKIEKWIDKKLNLVDSVDLGKAIRVTCAQSRYIEFCKSTIATRDLEGLHVVLDCANGAGYNTAPQVFREMGAQVTVIGNEPDGININHGVGSTNPEIMAKKVKELRADVGIALDGDGDRCIMADHTGKVIDGDDIVYVLAKSRYQQRTLHTPVVGTLMSNLGLERAIEKFGVQFLRANVGDKYVLEMLNEHGGTLGGESSGHILCLDKTTTGDGIISALQVIEAMRLQDETLESLSQGMKKMPQILINVKVDDAAQVMALLQPDIDAAEQKFGKRGRILVRPSGTEPLIRIMAEGERKEDVYNVVNALADQARKVV
jgi:phosphoglucosamine mutase